MKKKREKVSRRKLKKSLVERPSRVIVLVAIQPDSHGRRRVPVALAATQDVSLIIVDDSKNRHEMVKLERCGAVASHADLRECLHDLLAYEVSRGKVHPQELEEVLENAII